VKHYKAVDGKLMVECVVCGAMEKSGSDKLSDWEMQHLHFSDAELEVLTCGECKNTDKFKLAELAQQKARV
jgi:Zn ribbon nucleic-acid-binding protein